MSKRVSKVTFHYMLITAGFWMSFCLVSTNAAVFLQGMGYSNVQLGLILALGNVGGALLSTLLGDLIDRHPAVRHATVLNILSAIQAVMLILLFVNQNAGFIGGTLYVLYTTALMAVNAVNLDLCVRLEHAKVDLNFGLARSTGSLSFMVVSIILGMLTDRFGHLVLIWAGLVIIAFQVFGNLIIDRDMKEAESRIPAGAKRTAEASSSLIGFMRENGMFCVFLLGIILIFTAHNMDGNFMINEIRALGGGTVEMGWIAAFQALVEVPVMIFASRLPRKWNYAQYIRLSFIFFVVKMLAYALAPNIPAFFAARILQAPSYALYIVLVVPYADQIIPHKDSAKAQGLLVSVTNIGAVLASLAGGAMFDSLGVRPTMLIATVIAAVGAAVGILGTRDRRESLPR